MKKNTIRTALQ